MCGGTCRQQSIIPRAQMMIPRIRFVSEITSQVSHPTVYIARQIRQADFLVNGDIVKTPSDSPMGIFRRDISRATPLLSRNSDRKSILEVTVCCLGLYAQLPAGFPRRLGSHKRSACPPELRTEGGEGVQYEYLSGAEVKPARSYNGRHAQLISAPCRVHEDVPAVSRPRPQLLLNLDGVGTRGEGRRKMGSTQVILLSVNLCRSKHRVNGAMWGR